MDCVTKDVVGQQNREKTRIYLAFKLLGDDCGQPWWLWHTQSWDYGLSAPLFVYCFDHNPVSPLQVSFLS